MTFGMISRNDAAGVEEHNPYPDSVPSIDLEDPYKSRVNARDVTTLGSKLLTSLLRLVPARQRRNLYLNYLQTLSWEAQCIAFRLLCPDTIDELSARRLLA
jgi:hypothetical protein